MPDYSIKKFAKHLLIITLFLLIGCGCTTPDDSLEQAKNKSDEIIAQYIDRTAEQAESSDNWYFDDTYHFSLTYPILWLASEDNIGLEHDENLTDKNHLILVYDPASLLPDENGVETPMITASVYQEQLFGNLDDFLTAKYPGEPIAVSLVDTKTTHAQFTHGDEFFTHRYYWYFRKPNLFTVHTAAPTAVYEDYREQLESIGLSFMFL